MSESYDFDYITLGLGLIRISDRGAISPAAIDCIGRTEDGENWEIKLRDDSRIILSEDAMAELERKIRDREEMVKNMRRANIDEEAKAQVEAQAKAFAELSGSIAPGGVIVNAQPGKRFRQ